MTQDAVQFAEWAIVELFGHTRLAGRVTEATIGGCSFVRVDVPTLDGGADTHFFGQGAIYAIHPVEELVARSVARKCRVEPVRPWELPVSLPQPAEIDDDGDAGQEQ